MQLYSVFVDHDNQSENSDRHDTMLASILDVPFVSWKIEENTIHL